MRILGIETSCDETGVAIYDEDKGLIANQLYTQITLHTAVWYQSWLLAITFAKQRH